jgi:hypothetical protein
MTWYGETLQRFIGTLDLQEAHRASERKLTTFSSLSNDHKRGDIIKFAGVSAPYIIQHRFFFAIADIAFFSFFFFFFFFCALLPLLVPPQKDALIIIFKGELAQQTLAAFATALRMIHELDNFPVGEGRKLRIHHGISSGKVC